MKKYYSFFAAVAMMFAVTSCSQEEVAGNENATSEYVSASFNINTPEGMNSRAIGDDIVVDKIVCAVYNANGEELVDLKQYISIDPNTNGGNPKATFNTRLAKGHKYRVAFFAYNVEANAYDVSDLKNIKVNTTIKSNDVRCDAFTAYYDIDANKTMNAINAHVTLKRPFAQLNLGIDQNEKNDAEKAGISIENSRSQIKVSNVYKAFSAYDDEVVGNASDMVYQMNNIPEGTFEVNNQTYYYLAMNYLLVKNEGSEKSLTDIELTFETLPKISYLNVPVQRNYRTNIYGKLLTSSVDIEIDINQEFKGTLVSTSDELKNAIASGGTIKLTDDITTENTIDIKAGVDVHLDLNSKKITIDPETLTPNGNGSHYAFIVREGGSLTIDGDGIVEATTPAPILFYPAGDLVIESGTFIRNIPEGYDGNVGSMFVGTKPAGGWESTGVTIKGGYFDSGYYEADATDVEDILTGNKDLEETEEDIKKRGAPGDTNKTRVALKNNTMKMFNRSNNYFKIYGGAFVGANPAWGDEGCMLPTTPYYLRPWSYYQGPLLDGQIFHEDGIVLPEGYAITKSTHEDGRPIYTVTYNK